ncbi:lipopolysaccharide biosynthesis protein [Hydrogenophaga sp. PBL-H3]|uniref:lipopolysaccharide biosynthesis protein n=1 Tax=Hydrogenophaga sp. PBL-H3 TaxID=434010 RepID=UPI00132010CE|nr:lipopolysaccharide biosynthesis protein [Hydrogenophaga sp. PBL-H3]QHE76715.1 lipopolysaccharide biosynthesis protein [Hydrogenophaga sp. PBL-H3]QHE81139.1 lipopolysaccharide biosynthesis protein [Hydrogenophaga sp. PBL-H3]
MTAPHATGKQIAKGAAWLMGFKLLDKSIGLISTLVLVRVLTPSDFGLVAMAMAVVSLLELMGAFGFDSALIQRQDTERSHFDTAWTFNVIFGVAIAILLLVMAVPAAAFYREPRLELMLPALAIGAVVGGFENIGTVAFRKELNFRMEFKYLLIKRVAVFIVVVTLAFTLRSFWALIFATIAGKLMAVAISYLLHPYRPRFSLAARADLFHFSKWLFISNLIQFLHSRSTDFILGRTVGSYGLGIYNLAAEISAMPSTELIAPLNRAVYPAYAQLARVREKLLARFLEVYGLISLLSFPVAVGLFCLSDLVVNLLLGAQWVEAVPILQILGLCGLVGALQGNMYVVMSAMGKPKANTLLSASLLAVSLPAVVLASLHYGALGAAYAHFVSALLGFAGIVYVFTRVTGAHKRQLAAAMWRPMVASAFMAAILLGIGRLAAPIGWEVPLALHLLGLVAVGAVAYAVIVAALWWIAGRPESAEKVLLNFLGNKLLARRPAH